MKAIRTFALAATALLAAHTSYATTVIPPTFDELVGQAELIFQGTVTDVKSQFTGEGAQRHIVSYVTFKVDDAIKGDAGASYTIRMLGGTVDGQTMEVTESPKFKVGDRDIVFVENNGKQFVPLVGIMHGRFRVQKDQQTGTDLVVTDHGHAVKDLAALGKEHSHGVANAGKGTANAAPAAERSLGAADFKAAVRAKLNAQQ